MMEEAKQLELQAYLDGELSPAESATWQRRLEEDRDLRALASELKTFSTALAVFEAETKVPASREFYWSGIRRQIESLQHSAQRTREATEPVGWLARIRQYLVPASVAAVFLIAGMLATQQVRMAESGSHRLEASVSGPGSFTYRDFSSGVTLVWLTYPAEKEFAEIDTILRIP